MAHIEQIYTSTIFQDFSTLKYIFGQKGKKE